MTIDAVVSTPLGEYELIDFGEGRKLERFGPYLVDRPAPKARGAKRLHTWDPDWMYINVAASGQWRARSNHLPNEWMVKIENQWFGVRLEEGGGLGIDPVQVACWRWVRERLAGCYHIDDLQVLNLFAGSGGASAAAVRAGATVTHVDGDSASLELARSNLDSQAVEWIHEDAHGFVDEALRRNSNYDVILLRPCSRQRGPHGRAWDITCDLGSLLSKLPRLAARTCRGVWLSPKDRDRDWNVEALDRLLRDAFPGRHTQQLSLGIATADGRVLASGVAACWFDDDADLDAATDAPVDAETLEELLDAHLDPVLSSRRTAAGPARSLAQFSREQQDFVLRWVEIICRTNAEMAYQFAANAPQAMTLMNPNGVEEWILQAMDAFDTAGLRQGVSILQSVEAFADEASAKASGVSFDVVSATLEIFVHGLSGRKLKLECGDRSYTDTETIYLPPMANRFANPEDNFRLYKALLVQLWAQTWFGTFRTNVQEALQAYDDPQRALRHFQTLEAIRLDACIERELPGLHRQLRLLREQLQETLVPSGWEDAVARLRRIGATSVDSVEAIRSIYLKEPHGNLSYQGDMDLARVEQLKAARKAREKREFQTVLFRMAEEALGDESPPQAETLESHGFQFDVEHGLDQEMENSTQVEFTLDGKPVAPPADAKGLISSIIQDFGEIPPEYLVAAGAGGYKPAAGQLGDKSQDVWKGTYHEEGAFLYNEWDHKRQHYRKNWCVLREIDVSPRNEQFVAKTLTKYGGLVKNIRRTFEVLRGEEKLLKKQPHGDDVDVDALVEAYGDVRSGMEMTDRLFTRKQKVERNIAVMFMVDMSGSTKGWINDAERESLILLCEALETLGDRYAIYGFSGMTRKRCELYRVKRFEEPYSDEVKSRIAGIAPQDYTRMGVTIRHLSRLLNEVEARTRLLITLSDGKPDDFDGYRGEYGIEDTRMALIEAKRDGIHPFCITIDEEARDYLPHMYGAVNYAVIDNVAKLPLKVSDIYRKLTS